MNRLFAFFAVLAVLATAASAFAQDREFSGMRVSFGNLHAHSKLSDDVSGTSTKMRPVDGFKTAHAAGLDFIAITDHHKAVDSSHRLYLEPDEFKELLYDVAMAYNSANAGKFVAIPGLEWGNTATGNHVNLLGARELPPDSIRDRDYDELYDWAKSHCDFVQFNHPYSWAGESHRDKTVGNFGAALYSSEAAFVESVGPVAKTISIISSVAGGHISGAHRHSTKKTHRAMNPKAFAQYLDHLNAGFHLSPAANQDTHWKNFGTVTAARTAVWSSQLTYSSVMEGFKKNRVYATEDDEMAVAFQVAYKGATHWMGEQVTLDSDEEDITVLVRIWQVTGSDSDGTDEGPYTVRVWSDHDGSEAGTREAAVWSEHKGIASNTLTEIPLPVVSGEYIFLEVVEEQGTDNPVGDGEDEFDNKTGDHSADKKRDAMNDTAWTSPVWFVR